MRPILPFNLMVRSFILHPYLLRSSDLSLASYNALPYFFSAAKSLHRNTLNAAQCADAYQASADRLATSTDQFIVNLQKGSSELQATYDAFCSRKEVLVIRLRREMAEADGKRADLLKGMEELSTSFASRCHLCS
jgi:hypothetical protein